MIGGGEGEEGSRGEEWDSYVTGTKKMAGVCRGGAVRASGFSYSIMYLYVFKCIHDVYL